MPTSSIPLLLASSQGDALPLGQPAPASGNAHLASTIAASAMFLGALLVAYWYRRRLLAIAAAKGLPAADLTKDLSELTERLANELDAKAERIETLIAAADERIRHLERLQLETPAPFAADSRLIEPRPMQPPHAHHRTRHEPPGPDVSHQEVYDLADAGLSPVDIARKLDKPTGQVELILNLRRGTVAL